MYCLNFGEHYKYRLLWRRRLVVSPSALEESPDAAVRARWESRHLQSLNACLWLVTRHIRKPEKPLKSSLCVPLTAVLRGRVVYRQSSYSLSRIAQEPALVPPRPLKNHLTLMSNDNTFHLVRGFQPSQRCFSSMASLSHYIDFISSYIGGLLGGLITKCPPNLGEGYECNRWGITFL